MALTLYLIRHGLTAGNAARRYIGSRTDEPLSEQGRRELLAARSENRYPQADALYSGSLLRCTETARLLYPMLAPLILPALNELNFGTFEGKTYEQLKNDPTYQRWIDSAGRIPPPGGESGRDFSLRLQGALGSIANDVRRTGARRAAAVTHGGCIMTLLSEAAPSVNRFYAYQTVCGGGFRLMMDIDTLQISEISPL
ncbi:MAG: histidine phosphatase family protein [Clostridiales bacterium]|nr:histidine phosphatase family protein [Clostridiales bacterium]